MSLHVDELGQDEVIAKVEPGDLRLWSVTTIIDVLKSEGIVFWACEQAAIAALRSMGTWQAMRDDQGDEEAIKWLRDARFRKPKDLLSAAAMGTVVHQGCEEWALSGVRPDLDRLTTFVKGEAPNMDADAMLAEARNATVFLDRFGEWLDRFQPEYLATEVAVYHPEYGYAGTSDGFMVVDGFRAIFDYKTSRRSVDAKGRKTGPYPEAALQLAGYRHAKAAAVWRPRVNEYYKRRYYLLSAAEQQMAQPVPEVDGGLVIHITPEHCDAYPVRCDETVFEAFLYVLEAARWSFELSQQVIGPELVPPTREEVPV